MEQLPHELPVKFPASIHIPTTPERDELAARMSEAYDEWYFSHGTARYVQAATNLANSVGDIPGLELVRAGAFGRDYHNRCAHYVFGEVLAEPWAAPGIELPYAFWSSPLEFLNDYGYGPRPGATPGAIIAYFNSKDQRPDRVRVQHFALLQEGTMAVSKLGQGPVVRHPLELVPTDYGDRALFLGRIALVT